MGKLKLNVDKVILKWNKFQLFRDLEIKLGLSSRRTLQRNGYECQFEKENKDAIPKCLVLSAKVLNLLRSLLNTFLNSNPVLN